MRPVLIAASAAILWLAGCASLAPYGPQVRPGGQGFTEQRIEADRFRVTYNGVGAPGPVTDLALRRAAELTLAEGADWFEVTQRYIDGRPDSAGGVRPSVSVGASSGRYGGSSTSGVGVGIGLDLSGPQPTSTTLELLIGRGPQPDRREVYDAREVLRALGG